MLFKFSALDDIFSLSVYNLLEDTAITTQPLQSFTIPSEFNS